MTSQICQKGFQGLHLEPEKSIELPVTEATEDPLSSFELHRHLTQGDRQSRENLPRIAFTDTPFGQSGESEDPICEPLRCHRHSTQACAPIGEVVDHSGSDPQILATSASPVGCTALDLRSGFRTRLRFISNICKGVHQRSQVIADRLELSAPRRFRAFEQVLCHMARLSNLPETHHPAGALEGVQLSPELSRRLFVFFQARDQLEDPIETLAGFFEKERVQIVVGRLGIQIFVQFKRFTSTPRVPTISPSASRTAIAIVKQGSSVKSDS